ncbi:alginate lyase-domain-containing protein [Xylariales sp. PMI_506]|nr:alginate lyase-domain-containing protein [Xylariales sp. PMI_506]
MSIFQRQTARGPLASLIIFAIASPLRLASALSPSCAPGGNFDLSVWDLQLPIGSTGDPTTISTSALEGCSGYENFDYFFTESGDGALVMKVPGSPDTTGCVTTANSEHCRTELRETNPSSWDPNAAVNRLTATLAVLEAGGSTCIGQIHIDDSISTKPVAELYYADSGAITIGVEQTRAGGNQIVSPVGNIPLGQVFSYEIRYEGNVLEVALNGGAFTTFSTYSLDAPSSYFKVGNYLQGDTASDVHFFAIGVTHSTSAGTCSVTQPAITANTVTLNLYSDDTCCSSVETIKMGTLNECHNGNAAFGSFTQAVATTLFNQGIHILLYADADCAGDADSINLTNTAECWPSSAGASSWQSFMISAS